MESAIEYKSVLDNIDKQRSANLLADLLNISSPSGEEKEIAKYLVDRFQTIGLKGFLQEADTDRYNAVGILEGDGTGLSIMFNGHLDTTFSTREKVDAKGRWAVLPAASSGAQAVVDGDKIHGVGATNMKGGLTAFTMAAEAIKKAGVKLRGDLVLAGVIGEIIMAPVDEYKEAKLRGYTRGTQYLITHGVTTDMAIVAEPSGSVIRLGHFGPQWIKISTHGISVNTSDYEKAISPIDRMLKIIGALKAWIPKYQEKICNQYPHMKTKPVVRIAAINGGTPWKLARPGGSCSVYLDIRTKQSPPELKREIVQLFNRLREEAREEDPEFDFEVEFYLTQPGAEVTPDHDLVKALERAHQDIYQQAPQKLYNAIDSDASVLTHYGIPAIQYGPRSLDRSIRTGGLDYQDINDVIDVAKVFAILALDICSRQAETT